MAQYRKKPVVIEARQIDSSNYDEMCDIATWCGGRSVDQEGAVIAIDTLEGTMLANPKDYIIRGVQGEFYPCKPDIFEATYEAVSEWPATPPSSPGLPKPSCATPSTTPTTRSAGSKPRTPPCSGS